MHVVLFQGPVICNFAYFIASSCEDLYLLHHMYVLSLVWSMNSFEIFEFECFWLFCKMPKSKEIVSSSGSESEEDDEVNLWVDFYWFKKFKLFD